jgi:hypothetical protein
MAKGKRTPALEYRWFSTDISKLGAGDPTKRQTELRKEFAKIEIAGVKLDTIKDLGLAFAPIPFINWLGLFPDALALGEKIEQANEKGTDGKPGKKLDNVVRSRLSSVDNIEVVFAKGTQIKSGKIAASQAEAGQKIDLEPYETKQFSVGFPAQLTATKGETDEPLYPVIERKSGERSKTRSKGISMTLFEAWTLNLPGKIFAQIAAIRAVTRSQESKISSRFSETFFSGNGALLPTGDIIDAEIIEDNYLITPSYSSPLYLPAPKQLIPGQLFEDII